MADRYWVGGTATWDATAGTKWAATSGGTGGASVPTTADNVFFDASSGAGTVTIGANASALNLDCTGFTGTLSLPSIWVLSVNGNLTFSAGMTFSGAATATLSLNGSGTHTVTTAGKSIGCLVVFGNTNSGSWSLQDALTATQSINIFRGTFTTNNFNVTATSLLSNNSNTRTINLGSSTVTLSLASSGAINFSTQTGLTFNAGTSNIVFTGGTSAGVSFSATGGATFYNVSFTGTNTGSSVSISGTNTFNNFSVTAPSAAGVKSVTFTQPCTINGTLSTTGTAGNRRVWFQGFTYGIAQTLTINSAPSLTDADFRDIYVVGTAAPISGTRIGDLRGCRGITFSTPKTVYWNLAGAQNWSANGWSDTSTGTPNTDFFPLAQDTATFTNAGSVTGTITLDTAIPYTGSIDMSGRTTAMTLALNAFTIYGSWTNGSGTSITISNNLTFSGRNTQTITSAGKTFSGGIIVDSYGGTVQLADALNIGSSALTVTNGTFDTKNFNVTAGTLSSSNSNVRTITLGSSTLTLSTSGSGLSIPTTTNLTFNADTSQINISGSSGSISSGGLVFYSVAFTGSPGAGSADTITGANTFTNFSITAPSSAFVRNVSIAANQTITGTLTCAGATAVRRIFLRSDTLGTTRTLTVGTLSATDCDFRDITIAGAAAGSSPTRAGDCGGNTGITFPSPKTVYWNLAGTQNWSATGWASSSGGTPDINNFPLAQDTAVFDNTGAITQININAAFAICNVDMSARTSAMTWNGLTVTSYYGDWKFGTGVTHANNLQAQIFSKRGIQTITSNGVAFKTPINVDCFIGTVQLADALTLNPTYTLTLTSGTFDAVSYNVTVGVFSAVSAASGSTLKMGSGTWTLSGTGSIWVGIASGVNFYKGTANIVLSDTSTSARTFLGSSLSYNKLTIGGTTGTSTLTINGNNQFTELASTKTVAHTIALGSTTQTFGKWTVTGTVGNVVTVTGTATITIAGACTSGLDYLALGTTTVSATSPGEFYAGANSTATSAAAPLYLTAKPADSTRYWVGGTGNWSDTARWSTGSGGASGAAVPRSHDDVVFDAASNATAYTATVNAVTGGIRMKSLTIAGPASGNVTLAGSTAIDGIHGNVTLPATGLTRTYTGTMTLSSNSTGRTFTTNGVTLASAITVNGVDCGWSLGSALNDGSSAITVTNGTLDLGTYNLTAGSISSDNGNSRTIDFDTGTTTLSGSTPINFGSTETSRANLTVTASTSQITLNQSSQTFSGNNQTFYNVSFTDPAITTITINGINTFNNLTFAGRTFAGISNISVTANQTVTGTLTFSAGTDATMRHFLRSDTIGTTRTITAAAVSMTDVDFRDITIAGAAAPASGTRIGDCKGNSGITFDAPKTVYKVTGTSWSATNAWATSSGGAGATVNFPLAQDTIVYDNNFPNSADSMGSGYNVGTLDMSARTNALTFTTFPGTFYGNWINGSGTTLSGTSTLTFAGRGSQTITSAGKTFTQGVTINSPSGSVTLQDAFTNSLVSSSAFQILGGTFDANGYNVSTTAGGIQSTGANTRTINFGSGTWTIAAAAGWLYSGSNLTVTGTGTISLTSASAKTFAGGGISYSGITLNQGGAGTLTISGNNTFKDITNTYSATGATTINIGTTTQRVSQWTATGAATRVLTVQGTSASSPGTLILTGSTDPNVDYLAITGVRAYSLTDTWYAGNNSTNNGSLGWYFETAPVPPALAAGNFLMFFN